MPRIIPQEMKAISSIAGQPDKMSSNIQLIIAMDIAGYNGNEIASGLGLSTSRVSVIRTTPFYQEERERRWQVLQDQVIDKKTDKIVAGDPIEQGIKALAMEAVDKYRTLLGEAKSEFVQKAVADSILDRAGYKARTDKTTVTIEVTEKMSDRFERVLGYGHNQDVGRTSIKTETTVSS